MGDQPGWLAVGDFNKEANWTWLSRPPTRTGSKCYWAMVTTFQPAAMYTEEMGYGKKT
jgi:hypothetical protein